MAFALRGGCSNGRWFFEDDMCVGAADSKSAHAGAARKGLLWPSRGRTLHEEGALVQVQLGVGLLKVKSGRKSSMAHNVSGMNQAGNARGDVEMADVGFGGADDTELFAIS